MAANPPASGCEPDDVTLASGLNIFEHRTMARYLEKFLVY
jgi:hypothetical protein